jgi:hypothetical protein
MLRVVELVVSSVMLACQETIPTCQRGWSSCSSCCAVIIGSCPGKSRRLCCTRCSSSDLQEALLVLLCFFPLARGGDAVERELRNLPVLSIIKKTIPGIYYIIRIVFFVFTETQFFYFGFKSALESLKGEYTSKHPLRPLNQNSLNTHISRKCREMACNM